MLLQINGSIYRCGHIRINFWQTTGKRPHTTLFHPFIQLKPPPTGIFSLYTPIEETKQCLTLTQESDYTTLVKLKTISRIHNIYIVPICYQAVGIFKSYLKSSYRAQATRRQKEIDTLSHLKKDFILQLNCTAI